MNPMHLESSSFRRLAGVALALALVLAGCGGSGDDADPTPAPDDGPTYAVSVSMEGLERPIELQMGESLPSGSHVGSDFLSVDNGQFTFQERVALNSRIYIQLTGDLWRAPAQGCRQVLSDGSLGESNATVFDVTADVVVRFRCGRGYSIGGTVTGEIDTAPLELSAYAPVYPPNQAVDMEVPGPFSMDPKRGLGHVRPGTLPILPGTPYSVDVGGDAACRITNGQGIMPDHDVDDVVVDCLRGTDIRYKVIGMRGKGMRILLDLVQPGSPQYQPGGINSTEVPGNGDYQFAEKAYPGARYEVSIYDQPAPPMQECWVINGTGVVQDDQPITNIEIRCPEPEKTWRYDRPATFLTDEPMHGGTAGFALVDEYYEPTLYPKGRLGFGITSPLYVNMFNPSGTRMAVYSSDDGHDYRIATEAAAAPDARITSLRTRWWLRKNSPNTDLRFLLSHLYLDGWVDNTGNIRWALGEMNARAWIALRVYAVSEVDASVNPVPVHAAVGHVDLFARRHDNNQPGGDFSQLTHWSVEVGTDADATEAIFLPDSIESDLTAASSLSGGSAHVKLKAPIPLVVNLDGVLVGQRVMVEMVAAVQAMNGYSIEGHAVAYLRDPATFEPGDSESALKLVAMEGLSITQPGPLPADFAPQPNTTPAAACASADAPRGTVQFAAASFTVAENDPTNRAVSVTRTGSLAGEVTARVRLLPGGALPGADYVARETVVRFGDGEAGPRSVHVAVIDDTLIEGPETLTTALDEPSGCADIGLQATANVTLLDDEERPPAPPPPSGLDTSFDGDGKVALPGVGFDGGTGLALQPDGKILIAGGGSRSFVRRTGFVLARYHADGRLDNDFGSGGVVLTELPNHSVRTPQRVVVQPDGKIVVAGFAAGAGSQLFPVLARYLADGTPDAGFGAGGVVVATTTGTVYALALMPDGRIVVAGAALRSGPTDFADVMVRRYLPNGTPDGSFGTAGLAVVDVAGKTNEANALVLLPSGGVIAAGQAVGTADTAIVQLTPQGQPDPAFGSGGVRDLAGQAVGAGLARQADGKLLLVGHDGGVPSRFAMLGLMPDGTTDPNFGNAGLVTTATSGTPHAAQAVAVTSSGRILVAGEGGVNRNFVLARYLADGTPDLAFNGTGAVVADFDLQHDIAKALVIQPDGRIVLGGTATIGIDNGFALVRVSP